MLCPISDQECARKKKELLKPYVPRSQEHLGEAMWVFLGAVYHRKTVYRISILQSSQPSSFPVSWETHKTQYITQTYFCWLIFVSSFYVPSCRNRNRKCNVWCTSSLIQCPKEATQEEKGTWFVMLQKVWNLSVYTIYKVLLIKTWIMKSLCRMLLTPCNADETAYAYLITKIKHIMFNITL